MRWLDGIMDSNGHDFVQTLGDGDTQGSLVCCSPWGCQDSDTTLRLNNKRGPQVVRKERLDGGLELRGHPCPTACSLEWAPWPTPWSLASRDPASAQAEDSEETAGLPGTFRDPALTWRTASSSVGLPDLSQAGWILFPGLPRGRETAGTTGHLLTYRLSSVCSVCCSHRAPSEYSTETYGLRDLMPAGSQSLAPH